MPTHLQRLAAAARALDDPTVPRPRTNDEARATPVYAARIRLRDALVDELGDLARADRCLSMWMICRLPIGECVERVREEPPDGWPVARPFQLGSPTGPWTP